MLDYNGITVKMSGTVYAPAEDSLLAAGFIEEYLSRDGRRGLRILDVGTGTGILGISAARGSNAGVVTFSDVNPDAVELAKQNCDSNRELMHGRCRFAVSDLFSGIDGRFDVVIFNAPYLRREAGPRSRSSEWWDGGKDGIEVSARFLSGVSDHLESGGAVFLVYSSLGNVRKLKRLIRESGFRIASSRSTHLFFEDIIVSRLERLPARPGTLSGRFTASPRTPP